MAKWQLGVLALFLVVFAITALLTGEPMYIIPVLILAGFVLLYAVLNRTLSKKVADHHDGDMESALSDEDEAIPSAHLIPDDETAVGDTPEAHDEITPHDLPLDHPGREAAEAQAGHMGGGTTRGNVEGGADGGGGKNREGRQLGG